MQPKPCLKTNTAMQEIYEKIRRDNPTWVAKKQRQSRPTKAQRQRNGRRPNCRMVELRPEYAKGFITAEA